MSRGPAQAEMNDVDSKVASSCLDLLLIELVPLAMRITEQLHARDQALIDQMKRSKIFNSPESSQRKPSYSQDRPSRDSGAPSITVTDGEGKGGNRDSGSAPSGTEMAGAVGGSSVGGKVDGFDEELRDKVFWRLDQMGYRVGQGLAERFSANKPRPNTPLDAIKFVCKDLWIMVFRKPIDNLKTNHRGIFVLTDNRFQPLSRMSVDRRAGPRAFEDAMAKAQAYLYFPCGIIRGALAALGMDVTVTADSMELPVGTFHIKTRGAKP